MRNMIVASMSFDTALTSSLEAARATRTAVEVCLENNVAQKDCTNLLSARCRVVFNCEILSNLSGAQERAYNNVRASVSYYYKKHRDSLNPTVPAPVVPAPVVPAPAPVVPAPTEAPAVTEAPNLDDLSASVLAIAAQNKAWGLALANALADLCA